MILYLSALGLLVEVNLGGRLILSELYLLALLPVLVIFERKGNLRFGPLTKQFYVFAGLWLFGAFATDALRLTAPADIARGWSKIVFLVTNFTAMTILVNGRLDRIVKYVTALAVMSFVREYFNVDGMGYNDDVATAWKFGYGAALAVIVFLASSVLVRKPATRLIAVLMPFADAVLNLALDARNLFGLTALASLALAATAGRTKPVAARTVLLFGLGGLVAAWGLVSAYTFSASNGYLGADAKMKYDMQATGSGGVLLGGRMEAVSSTQAVIDSPIIGHGSWAKDIHYVELLVTRMERAGYDVGGDAAIVFDVIPTHSHLMGAWVDHGILGSVFWFWVIGVVVYGLFMALRFPTPLTGFIVFIGLSFFWDILFSPFGLDRRTIVPAWLILMIIMIEQGQAKAKSLRSHA